MLVGQYNINVLGVYYILLYITDMFNIRSPYDVALRNKTLRVLVRGFLKNGFRTTY